MKTSLQVKTQIQNSDSESDTKAELHGSILLNSVNPSLYLSGELGGLVVEPRTPEREAGDSIPTSAVLCP